MFIEAPELSSYPNLRHAFFTRQGGVSDGMYASLNGGLGSSDDAGHVGENRRRMAEHLGVAVESFLSVRQTHSADVAVVERAWPVEARPQADAMVTRAHGIALGITTADCGPVLFADPHAGVVGAAHAGWRGALGGVLEATVAAMEKLGAARERIVAVLGPTIGGGAYEVGPEFAATFRAADAANERFFRPGEREGRHMFDLPSYIVARLAAAGLGEVEDTNLCTYTDEERFYSFRRSTHRKEPDYGRLVSAIRLTH
jgi:YfiH family protein